MFVLEMEKDPAQNLTVSFKRQRSLACRFSFIYDCQHCKASQSTFLVWFKYHQENKTNQVKNTHHPNQGA